MSNKERLLKERLYLAKKLIDSFIIFENLNDKDISLLVGIYKEAERVPELEKVVKHNFKHHKYQQEMIFDLEQQNKRYRELLEYVLDNGGIGGSLSNDIANELYVKDKGTEGDK